MRLPKVRGDCAAAEDARQRAGREGQLTDTSGGLLTGKIKMEDKQIQCKGCGRAFTFTANDQEFYNERRMSEPKRCKECREGRKPGGSLREQVARNLDALFKPEPSAASPAEGIPASPAKEAEKKSKNK